MSAAPKVLEEALGSRLQSAAGALGFDGSDAPVVALLERLVAECRGAGAGETWLVLAAILGAYPTELEILATRRALHAGSAAEVAAALLARALRRPTHRDLLRVPQVAGDVVVVRPDASPGRDATRVAAALVEGWHDRNALTAVATPTGLVAKHDPGTLVLPRAATVVLPPLTRGGAWRYLAAFAQYSGNRVAVVGTGFDPVDGLDVDAADPEAFAGHLAVVKHAHRVLAPSRAARSGYQAFVAALAAQGLPGPHVVLVDGITDAVPDPARAVREPRSADRPVVAVVGEPSAAADATVRDAASRLRADGVDLELRFVGDIAGVDGDVDIVVALRPGGLGLDLALALRRGLPALVADVGTLAEVARRGGCVIVDPDDDEAVHDALSRLVTRAEARADLSGAMARRLARPAGALADEAWRALVEDGRA